MIAKWLLKGLVVIVLILLAIVLTIITINGICRCYNYIKPKFNFVEEDNLLLVDLYSHNINSIPQQAMSGMTILIDLGITNLETGIYIVCGDEKKLLKLKLPEVNEKYKITKGEYAGYIHTIRPSFLEIRGPTETQIIIDNSKQQEIKLDTKRIIISPNVEAFDLILKDINFVGFRVIKLANLSKHIHTINSKYNIQPGFIGEVFIDHQMNIFL